MARTIRIFVVGCVLMATAGVALMPAGAATRPRAARVVTFDLDPLTEKQSRYWTDERVASLPEADAPELTTLNVGTGDTPSESAPVVSGDAVPPSVRAPVRMPKATTLRSIHGLIATEIPDPSQFPFSTHGKLVIFETPTTGRVCSGTIVSSVSESLVLTAAHCVVNDDGTKPIDIRFIPGYEDGARNSGPYGVWNGGEASFLQGYLSPTGGQPNYEFDLAAVRFAPLNGVTLQDAVGARGYLFNASGEPGAQLFNAFGYPAAPPFDGERLWTCGSPSGQRGNAGPGADMVSMACDMTEGSSGGGWIAGADQQNGRINSVVSIGIDSIPNVIFGPYFGIAAETLWSAAGGGTPPDPGPDPTEPVTHLMKLSLKLSGGLVASGRVTASDGYLPCTRNAPVGILKKTNAGWKHIKDNLTNEEGRYRMKIPNKGGRYVAVSPEGSVDDLNLCAYAESPVRRN